MSKVSTLADLQQAVEKISGGLDKAYNEAWDLALLLSEQVGDVAKTMLHRDSCPDWDDWESLVAENVADVLVVAMALLNYVDRDSTDFLDQAIDRHERRMSYKVSMDYQQIVRERLGYAHSKGFYLPDGLGDAFQQSLGDNADQLSDSLKRRIS
jgi:NTP pyrophosphatase (non-canonical NTP hydrolase)